MSHYPCYIQGQDEPVGYISTRFASNSKVVIEIEKIAGCRPGSFDDDGLIPVYETTRIELPLSHNSCSIDVEMMSFRHGAGSPIEQIMEILDKRGCPVGVTPVEVLNMPATMQKQFRWKGVMMNGEDVEAIFDEDWFVVDDKSKLIDPDCLTVFQSLIR